MAVLVEALNVIVRLNRIKVKFNGGLVAFKRSVPNKTFCMDSRLARVGFMYPADAENYIAYLERNGLTFISNGKATDIVVIDQFKGPTVACDWIELITIKCQDKECRACKLKSEPNDTLSLSAPVWWKFGEAKIFYFENEEAKNRMMYLGKEGSVECYFDLYTAKDLYVGRTTGIEGSKK